MHSDSKIALLLNRDAGIGSDGVELGGSSAWPSHLLSTGEPQTFFSGRVLSPIKAPARRTFFEQALYTHEKHRMAKLSFDTALPL
jgi:hypothetical protein